MSADQAAALLSSLSGGEITKDHPALKLFSESHPLTREFDFKFLGVENGVLKVSGSASEKFAHPGKEGFVHSSFISLIFDTVMGSVVLGELEKPQPIATVNMSVNHKLPVLIGTHLVCAAKFDGDEDDVAHASAQMIDAQSGELIATSLGTFMIGTRSKPMPKGG